MKKDVKMNALKSETKATSKDFQPAFPKHVTMIPNESTRQPLIFHTFFAFFPCKMNRYVL